MYTGYILLYNIYIYYIIIFYIVCIWNIFIWFAKKNLKIFLHTFLLSIVLLATLFKCFKYEANIHKQNLIANNFLPKKL